ncbi:MAG: efflux RND transporter permease subunit [Acidobacteriota bacterium]|nr:efflux RND transporter permease subunit [Acidobacteriota bacterium]
MQWLVEVCIARPVFTVMLMMAIIVVGVLGFITLGVDRFPNVDIPVVTVTVNNPGAAPAEIETEITKKIEDQINTVSGIDSLNSVSSEGRSQVTVEFVLSKDVDVAAQDVRDKINLIFNDLPETAEEPIIQKLDISGAPILQIAVSAPLASRELYDLADKQIGDEISNVSGVGEVTIVGGGEREIQIFLNPERMRAFNITATDVTLALQRQNQEIPGGRVAQGATEMTVRTMGKVQNVEDFKQIPVVKRDDYSVLLNEIAEVKDSIKETRSLSLLNGVSAVTLQIRKQSGENTLAVANAVKARLAEIQTTLPANVKMQAVGDQTIFIQASVTTVEEHLIVGSILACIVVFLFLWNVRMTIIAALAIPTSIVGTFAAMWALGYTLDTITMLALTLMIGIVIDDAIVVLENIHRFIVEKGMEPMQAASEGTREVSLAVMATSFSLLAVFLPVGFMGGIVGKFMGSFGLTAAAAIAISLFVSFSLTPMLSSRWIKREKSKVQGSKFKVGEDDDNLETDDSNPKSKIQNPKSIFDRVSDFYVWMLRWSMLHRWVIVVTVVAVLASNVLWFSIIGFNFIPEDDESQFQIAVETAQGTTLPATATVAERIAREMRSLPGVTDTLTTVGSGNNNATVNTGSVYVKLAAIEDRELTQAELLARAREILKSYPPELKLTAAAVNSIGGGGDNNSTIQYLLLGPDSNKLAEYSRQIIAKLKEVPEAIDVDTSIDANKPELRVTVDRQRAADLGVSVGDVSTALNILLTGSEATTFNAGADQYDVRVRASGVYRQQVEDLQQMSVRSDKNEIITLDQLVKIENSTSLSSIDRYNRQGQVTIYANIKPGESSSTVSTKLDEIVAELNLDPEYKTSASGDSENLNESIYYFILGGVVSFIFMYMILASQFESYIHPITILMTLPLAIPFGLVALIVTGQSLNLFAFLGILVLFGIVKKNAILQIDHTIGLRAKGMARDEAIIEANRDRLRPILMTTLAFIAGMIPLLISSGSGAATNRSIGTLVAGGQAFCLILTLLAVPVFYSIFDDWGNSPFFGKISARLRLFKQNFKRRLRLAYARIKSSFGKKTATTTASVIIVGLLTLSAVNFAEAQQSQEVEVVARNVNADDKPAESDETKKTKKVVVKENLTTKTGDENGKNNTQSDASNGKNDATEKPKVEPNETNKKTTETNTTIVKIPAPKIDYTRVGVQADQPLPLSLRDAIRLALEQNNDIKQSETDVRIAEFTLRRALGAYDPAFVSENYYQYAKTPSSSSLQGGSNSVTDKGFYSVTGLSGKVPRFGGSYTSEFSNSRTSSNSALNSLNPQYPSSLYLSYTQPLWRGLRIDETSRAIQVAKKNVSLSDAQFRQRVIQTIADIETAYWNLVYAMKNLQVQESGVRDAQAQLESNQRQVEQGTIAPIESVEAQNQVVTFQQNVYTAKVQVTEFENALKTLILPNRENPNWTRTITPTSEAELEVPRITLPEAVASALQSRPELAQIKTNQEINQINTRFYKDQTKPQIDLIGSYTAQGLAGRAAADGSGIFDFSGLTDRVNQLSALNNLPPLPTATTNTTTNGLNGGYFNSLGGLFSNKYPTYRIGVSISLPIGNRQAKGDLGSSLAEGTKLEYQFAQQRQNVEREIRNALESVNATEQRWKLAIKARELSQTLYDGERRQLIAGTSTTYLVLERQITLVAAQASEVQAQTDLNKAISKLQRAVGTSLGENGVTLQPIEESK